MKINVKALVRWLLGNKLVTKLMKIKLIQGLYNIMLQCHFHRDIQERYPHR